MDKDQKSRHEQHLAISVASESGIDDNAEKDTSPDANPHPERMPEHLVALPDPAWGLWQWVGLRGAGFPVAQVLRLASQECAESTDRFLKRKAQTERLYQETLQVLSREPKEVGWQLAKVARRVKGGKTPASFPSEVSAETSTSFRAFQLARATQEQAWSELQILYDQAIEHLGQVLVETARDKRFREAVLWQDREAVHTGIDLFLRQSMETGHASKKQRQHSQLIAKYLQRYTAKNDTIGFFGPVGWARWRQSGPPLEARPRATLLATRITYLETWCLDALGEVFARDSRLLPWAVPRPMPFLFLDGTALHIPFVARPVTLSPAQAAVFAACDGERTAKEIAQALLRTPSPGLTSEADVFATLENLRATRRIFWTFEVSAEEWYPERVLRQQIERVEHLSARQTALEALNLLERAHAAVADAAGDADRLDRALEHLEETFTALTGKAANRAEGKTYAGRTLVYEDCRRDIEVNLGPALLEELGRPLALLLTSARWLTYRAAQLYQTAFKEAYQELARKANSPQVPFATFWSWIQPVLPTDPAQNPIRKLEAELQARWASILALPEGQRRVHYASKHVQSLVEELFAAPHPGWPSACYHSPDIMVAATGQEALQSGDYQLVLGELHVSLNTLDGIIFVPQHPDPPALFRAAGADLPYPRIVPAFSKLFLPAKRTHSALVLPTDFRFIYGVDACGIPSAQALRPGALTVEEIAGRLIARTQDGRQQFDLLELLDGLLSLQVGDSFKLFPSKAHLPRVSIDRLVICRESWHLAPEELTFAFSKNALERYVGARQWAKSYRIPRFLFARTPVERKPYYIDLDSPLFVEMLAKIIRQTQAAAIENGLIAFTEMLPSPEQAWLPDADGYRYTSELRIVAVDQRKYSVPRL
jgi:hypothetical protein